MFNHKNTNAMAISKTTLISQLESLVAAKKTIRFKPIAIDKEVYDVLTRDGGETGVVREDNGWFVPLKELTIGEMKLIKSGLDAKQSKQSKQ